MSLTRGASFFTPETPDVRRHLWVVVSDPARDPDHVVIANFSSSPPSQNPDPPAVGAVVQAGEHPSLGHESFVRCELARVTSARDLERLMQAHQLVSTRPASSPLVERMARMLLASQNTVLEVKAVLQAQGL